jgi:hypothetical protein
LKVQSRNGINEAALRYELLQLPGIQDLVFVPQAGTFLVYLYGISPVVAPSLLALAQQRVDERAVFPVVGTAVTPDLVGISLATTITMTRGVGPAERSIILSNAAASAENYINNLRINEPLVINEIADRIRNADSRIADVGEANKQIPEIFIWRSRSDGERYSRFLVANYQPQLGERIIVENSRPSATSSESLLIPFIALHMQGRRSPHSIAYAPADAVQGGRRNLHCYCLHMQYQASRFSEVVHPKTYE